MKRVFALLASAAMALSVFAFAGCDGAADDKTGNSGTVTTPEDWGGDKGNPDISDETDGGNEDTEQDAIPGTYAVKTAAEVAEIIEGIDVEKMFDEDVTGIGVKSGVSGEFAAGVLFGTGFDADYNFKVAFGENGIAGIGEATIDTDLTLNGVKSNASLTATAYVDGKCAYGAIEGTSDVSLGILHESNDIDLKAMLNWKDIYDYFFNRTSAASTARTELGAEIGFNILNIIEMAADFGVTVSVDDSDGLKFKLSASAQTVWTLFDFISNKTGDNIPVENIKKAVTVNKFRFDIYLAIDSDGIFRDAKAVTDFSVTIDSNLFIGKFIPTITASMKQTTEIYLHRDTITPPSDIATDGAYYDGTQKVLSFIENFADLIGWDINHSEKDSGKIQAV